MADKEKTIEKRLTREVKKLGGLALKFLPFVFTGFPDRLVFLPGGRFRIVETKTKGGQLSPRQKVVIPQLLKLGFLVYVIDTDELLDRFLQESANLRAPSTVNELFTNYQIRAAA